MNTPTPEPSVEFNSQPVPNFGEITVEERLEALEALEALIAETRVALEN